MGILDWTKVNTPDSSPYYTKEILNPSNGGISINKVAVSSDSSNMWAVVRRGDRNGLGRGGAQSMFYKSTFSGIMWDDTQYATLSKTQSQLDNGTLVWDLEIAPDDSKVVLVVCSNINITPISQELWISTNSGTLWAKLNWLSDSSGTLNRFISSLSISRIQDNFCRYILIGSRDGSGSGVNNLHVIKVQQDKSSREVIESKVISISDVSIPGDVLCAKFSPFLEKDRGAVVLYTSNYKGHEGTWLSVGMFDINTELHNWQPLEKHVEIRKPDSKKGSSPKIDEIISAGFVLPSDFTWADSTKRCIFVFTRAINRNHIDTGLFRLLDNKLVNIFDNNASVLPLSVDGNHDKHIASISYWGTSRSGKLLVGASFGEGCLAQVPIWFSDTPFAHRISWYKTIKAPTGAGNIDVTTDSGRLAGYGNAHVQWAPAGELAFAGTGAATIGPWAPPEIDIYNAIRVSANWPAGAFNVFPNDESALSISRNNGETWNQISLINTMIVKLTDVTPSMDGTTVYLASVSNVDCSGFVSIWRTTINPNIASPLPAVPPLGTFWERVLVYTPHLKPSDNETAYPIVRTTHDYRDGQSVAVSAQGANFLLWSPDYGDYWQLTRASLSVQDFVFGSSTSMYLLGINGFVEKIAFNGNEWNSVHSTNTNLDPAHNIAVIDERYVLVGASGNARLHSVACSSNGGKNWLLVVDQIPGHGNIHVLFDSDFRNNQFYYAACDSTEGSIYRNTFPSFSSWLTCDLQRNSSQGVKTSVNGNTLSAGGKYGIVISKTGASAPALYLAFSNPQNGQNSVFRTLNGRSGLPSPGIFWDCMDVFTPNQPGGAKFSLEPCSLKISGCSTLDTNSTLYAIDDNLYAGNHNVRNGLGNMRASGESGMLWTCTDCLAKKGPILTMKDDTIVECEPLTYVNKAILFTWEQLCISTEYQLQIARDADFSLIVANIPVFNPASYSSPALAYFIGGKIASLETTIVPGLEIDVTYYWRCRVVSSANGINLSSPWSEVRKFSIKMKPNLHLSGGTTINSNSTSREYDFFISYATEDANFVDSLATYLSTYYKVWYSEFVITAGDSITQKVNEGLAKSRYGLVVLSPNFFTKDFPQRELGALFALMTQNQQKTIIPIWHQIGKAEILRKAALLADIRAINSNLSLDKILEEIRRAIT